MAKKLGRPPKPAGEQLAEIVPVRMTTVERELCQQSADRAGVKLTVWMRKQLLKAARREAKAT